MSVPEQQFPPDAGEVFRGEPPLDDQSGYGPRLSERLLNTYEGDPVGRETLAAGAAAVALARVPDFARAAFVTVTAAAVRVTLEGTAPTAVVGQHFGVGEHFTLTSRKTLEGFRVIREGAVDGSLDVEYFN